jgi:hypothetical protein
MRTRGQDVLNMEVFEQLEHCGGNGSFSGTLSCQLAVQARNDLHNLLEARQHAIIPIQ